MSETQIHSFLGLERSLTEAKALRGKRLMGCITKAAFFSLITILYTLIYCTLRDEESTIRCLGDSI